MATCIAISYLSNQKGHVYTLTLSILGVIFYFPTTNNYTKQIGWI